MKPEKHCEPSQDCAFRTTIGGQALIEGILMRGPEKQAIVAGASSVMLGGTLAGCEEAPGEKVLLHGKIGRAHV